MNQHGRGDGQAPKGSGTATAHGQAARQGTAATHAGRKPGEGIQPFIVPHQPSEETPALAGTLPSGSGGPEMEDPGQGTPERLPRDAVCTESALLQVTCYYPLESAGLVSSSLVYRLGKEAWKML